MLTVSLLLAVIAAIVTFSAQNETSASFTFLFWKFETSLSTIIFLAVLSGVLMNQLLERVMFAKRKDVKARNG